ncbi:MAG TPA: phenylacetate--CoA ligase family protein [bacterium]|jgi:phenylacetate-CoA ligase|nr:phenylacetate--CoA ligase family protein [bacterium]
MEERYLDPFMETLGREALQQIQLKKLQLLLGSILPANGFYRKKLSGAGIKGGEDLRTFLDYLRLPFTTKEELSADQVAHSPYGTNLTFPRGRYTHIHQTSGTKGEPLRWLDTEESWRWWARCWAAVYRAAGVTSMDRIFFAFSFGPFIGFWSAYEGAQLIGALAIPGGGMSSHQRAKAILANDVSVLVCTPTYALHLAEVAEQEGINIADSNVRVTIHAGEPGASIPGTKRRIESLWGARCYDHAGATEVGAWGFECQAQAGVHLNEGEFLCEVIDPATGLSADDGELVITNLGRVGMPIIRYRTGDRITLTREMCECGRTFARADGGVIGRIDDVLIVRGVNVFPSAIENIVRRFAEVGEFVVDVFRRHELDEIEVRIEVIGAEPEPVAAAVSRDLRNGLGLRVDVTAVPYGTLPRFDLKARRYTDHRAAPVPSR